ncbi:MAG: fibronectin type III domain-containing protein, partial [Thermoguttaceae bacterium]|nr:fibronectin type III domain-containing protein [Thermoguttaceae bacterium]
NCAIVGNHIARFGGGVYAHGGNVAFYNTINVDNTAGADPASADVYNYRGTATACNVLSRFTGWNGGGNNYVYNGSQPLFKNPANGDYTLAANSQALEKGNNVYVVDATGNALPTDLTGAPRFNGTVDLGPYEYWREERLSAPSLTVSAASSSALSVAIGGVANASSYALQYSTTADFTAATTVTETYASAGTYTPTGLSANTTYYVRVKAVGDGSTRLDSAWSSVKFATTAKVALTDVTLRGTAKVGETLTASVSPNGATASYRWYCGTNATDVTTEVSGATSATFTLTSAYVGAYLKVVATGTGDYCGSVSATVDLVPPAAPTNVKFGPYDGASRQATLVWADNATNEARYEARYSVDGGATWTTLANLAANATSRVCGDLSDGKTYLFQIRAVAANGLASDWSGASLLVPPAPAFGASEYVVEQNGAFYLAANDASDAALTYYWDLSGSEVEDSSNFIERDSGFWTSVDELGFGVGEHTIRLRSRDANGNFSATAAATLRVVATTPTIHATASTFADGAALRLDLRATTPDGSPIARWRFDWGDGQTSDFAELSDALTD